MDCETLLLPEHDQRLVFYTAAPGTPSYDALQLLKVVGVQDVGGCSAMRPDRVGVPDLGVRRR